REVSSVSGRVSEVSKNLSNARKARRRWRRNTDRSRRSAYGAELALPTTRIDGVFGGPDGGDREAGACGRHRRNAGLLPRGSPGRPVLLVVDQDMAAAAP